MVLTVIHLGRAGGNRSIVKREGALIAKIDVKSAYRLIPVYPGDRKWLGMEINGQVYIDGMLPFGLRSASKLFNALADALEWCVAQEGVDSVFHYLDDFAVVGPPNSEACAQYLHTLVRVCGVPLAPEKQEGPTSVITFLLTSSEVSFACQMISSTV